MSVETAIEFWNTLDETERKEIVKIIVTQRKLKAHEFITDKEFHELPHSQQLHLKDYYDNVILPQKGKQQVKYDGIIAEELPAEMSCPRCDASPVSQVQTKRGIHIKCSSCNYDSNQVFDFSKDRRRGYVMDCMKLLKNMFPKFNYIENTPYSPDFPFSGRKKDGPTKYDIKVMWIEFGTIARIRLEINQHLTKKQFYDAEECYIIGRREIVDYLNNRDALIAHLLVDEEKESDMILMSRASDIIKHNIVKEDRFKNIQYFIPRDLRKEIVKSSRKDMMRLITADFFELMYKNIGIF